MNVAEQEGRAGKAAWQGLLVPLTRSMLLVLFGRSFGGIARVPRPGLGQGFVDQAGYFNALLDALVENKSDRRRKARLEAGPQLALDESGRVLEPVQTQLLLLWIAHDRNVDLRVLQVGRDLGAGDGHAFDARVLQLEQDGLARHFANHLGDSG